MNALRVFLALLLVAASTRAFAGVEQRTWGAVKEMYRGVEDAIHKTGPSQTAMTPSQWHALTNAQRNAHILSFIRARVNMCTPYNCKTWVQYVIPAVSGGAVYIPTTAPNAYGWYWNPAPYVVGFCTAPHNVQPGQILQMWYGGDWRPHTAFVDALDGNGMYWIDCNWDLWGSILRHYIPFSQFYGPNRKVRQFSVHQIY